MNNDSFYQDLINQSQGRQNTDISNANAAQANAANYNTQTNAAQQGVSDFAKTMVDPNAMYNNAFAQSAKNANYNAGDMTQAIEQNRMAQGALQQSNADALRGFGQGGGMSGSDFAQQYQSRIAPLQTVIGNQSKNIGDLNAQYQNVLSGAGTQAQQGYQQQSLKQAQLQQAFTNAQAQLTNAQSMQQYYSTLANTEAGLTKDEQAGWNEAKNTEASIRQIQAQIAQAYQQTEGFRLANIATQRGLDASANAGSGQQTVNVGGSIQPAGNLKVQGGGGISLQGGGGGLQGGNFRFQ